MSTKSSIVYKEGCGDHKIDIHIFRDMHQVEGTVVFEIGCSTCYCNYTFLMDKHIGMQLAEIIKKGLEEQ